MRNISKDNAIEVLLQYLNADIKDTFFCDASVDIPMIENCAIGVAMKNITKNTISFEDLNRSVTCLFPEMKDVLQERMEALHNEFVASAKAVSLTLQKNLSRLVN